MTALKNLFHAAVLAGLAVLGVLFTLKTLFAGGMVAPLLTVASFWAWFACFAGATSFIVSRFEKPAMALVVHGGLFLGLAMLPKVFPLNLLRLGLDLLGGMV